MASSGCLEDRARRAAATISSKSPTEALGNSLINDRPTIDTAIKNMMSLCVARSFAGSDPNGSQIREDNSSSSKCFFVKSNNCGEAALFCARALTKAINGFNIPIESSDQKRLTDDSEMEYEVVRIVWNGLIQNKQKPTKILGLQSLTHAYPLILASFERTKNNFPDTIDPEEAQAFISEFGTFLQAAERRRNVTFNEDAHIETNGGDDDSCLLWDKDGGNSELLRRRKSREHHASFFVNDQSTSS